ncbi:MULTISPECIES: DEAD/DEAH box helicase [Halobacterium]|uniref:DEAD/DEAH box helicase n=1 Tax=Halobacterium TaxID=2239 RepID=UPI00159EC72A|nr:MULTISPECIES: DEAD/DEAH box helicase [Halobacterium]MCF2237627.1 DUF1998 domain-containing protein [Halobacterium salinarum]
MSNESTRSSNTVLDAESLAESFPEYEQQLQETAVQAASDADTVPPGEVLPDVLAEQLEYDLYAHQAEALRTLKDGSNVSVATSTSSGKTWVYALYFALRKLENPDARGLFLYPTKALSAGQQEALNGLFDQLGVDARAETYDGDTDQDRKQIIRERVDVPISNFAGINQYLDAHQKWRAVFANCELVVIDEAHTYSGVHGMHVSWVIRRLRRLLDHYGADPQLVCTTATIGNPAEHARLLTGAAFDVIADDGSPHGRREIAFWQPPLQDDGDVVDTVDDSPLPAMRKSTASEAASVLAHLTNHDMQTLMFTDSRQGTEISVKRAIENASAHPASRTDTEYAPYHAGLSQGKREATENALRAGEVDGVVSTSALELGIDIGTMDATVISGYPGTRQSFWQRIGRAGRGTSNSLAVYVPETDGVDQYIMDNPAYLLGDNIEDAVVTLSNNPVFAQHVLCAASERPLTRADADWFGPEDRLERAVEMWADAGQMGGSLDRGAQYSGTARPQSEISIYTTSGEQYEVRQTDGEIDMEPLDKERVYRQYHPGAIVVYDGQQYEVQTVVEDTYRPYVEVESTNTRNYTQAIHTKTIDNLSVDRTRSLGNGYQLAAGMGRVVTDYSAYNVVDMFEGTVEEPMVPIDLPPISIRTQLMWISFPDRIIDRVRAAVPTNDYLTPDADSDFVALGECEYTLAGGLHGGEHGMIKMSPLELRLDNDDLGGLSQLAHPEVESPVWFIHDAVEGGVGFAHSIYDNFEAVAERTRERIAQCDCGRTDGCPACLMSSQCGNQNEPLHRTAATELLDAALAQLRDED